MVQAVHGRTLDEEVLRHLLLLLVADHAVHLVGSWKF
jgi:hypothetical protein